MFMNNYNTTYETRALDAIEMYRKLEGYSTPAAHDCKDACIKTENNSK